MEVALPEEAPTAGSDQEVVPARLPMEILTDILARLPAKSVGRFRCVSRAWCSMLSSAQFGDFHACRANRRGHPRLLLTPVGSSYDGDIYSWQPGGQVEKLMPDCFGDGNTAPLTKPCRGLILIHSAGGYFVCNPSMGGVVPLPDSKVPLKMIWRPPKSEAGRPPFFLNVSYGLGYCKLRKEFKVVRLFAYGEVENDVVTSAACEVFVLDTPAYWRPAASHPPLCWVDEKKPGVFLNGYLHFLCSDGGITTFNVSDETFGSLSPPQGLENSTITLTELGGCLCVCSLSEAGYGIFKLTDYKEAQWEKFCCIEPWYWPKSKCLLMELLWIAPLGIHHSDDREKILFGTSGCKVFAIDANGGAPDLLLTPDETIIGSCEDYNIPALGLFEESLVSVGHSIEELIFSSPTTKAWSDILKWLPTHSVLELSLVCWEWRAMSMTDRFIQSHVIHANLNKSPCIMFIMNACFGSYMDLENCIAAHGGPTLFYTTVCSQPCHGLNAGSCNVWDFICILL
jgi:F-box interacting protein